MWLSLINLSNINKRVSVKKILFISLFIFCILFTNAKAEIKFYKGGIINTSIGFSYNNSSSYYDFDGSQQNEFPDTVKNIPKNYMFKNRCYEFTLNAEAYINDHWAVYASIPFDFRTYSETYIADTNSPKYQKDAFNFSRLSYYTFGTKAYVNIKDFSTEIFGDLSIPTGSHNGILDDSTYKFYYDGDFEFNLGAAFQYDFEKSWLGATLAYNNRSEGLSDLFKLNLELGLRTVPGTFVKLYSNMLFALDKFNETLAFNPRKVPLQENNVQVGAAFNIMFDQSWYSEISYDVSVAGKNTFVNSAIKLKLGYLINSIKK